MDQQKAGPLRAVEWGLEALYRTVLTVSVLGVVVVVLVVSWQVFSRYVTESSVAWAPELAQVSFVWAALLAISVGVRQGKHLVVDAFLAVKSHVLNLALNTITTAVVVSVSLVIAWYGYDSLSVSFSRTFPGLGIPTGWMHLAAPVGFLCCAIFAIESWFKSTFGSESRRDRQGYASMIETLDESTTSPKEVR